MEYHTWRPICARHVPRLRCMRQHADHRNRTSSQTVERLGSPPAQEASTAAPSSHNVSPQRKRLFPMIFTLTHATATSSSPAPEASPFSSTLNEFVTGALLPPVPFKPAKAAAAFSPQPSVLYVKKPAVKSLFVTVPRCPRWPHPLRH